MPYLLYIDTSGKTATVALSGIGPAPLVQRLTDAREQAAQLNTAIGELLAGAGLMLSQIDGIAVCAGPGSYTGLRVGLSTAKGLAFALNKPLMLFNTLDMLAARYRNNGALVIALRARAGEYFYARYDAQGKAADAPRHIFEQEIEAPGEALFLTDNEALFPDKARILPEGGGEAELPSWINDAETRFAQGLFDDLAYSEPFYLKAAYTTQSKK